MESNLEISDFISELISRGFSSIAREGGANNLIVYKKIDDGLNFLTENENNITCNNNMLLQFGF